MSTAGLKPGDRVTVRVGAGHVDATVIDVYGQFDSERIVVELHTSDDDHGSEASTASLPVKALEHIYA